MKRKSSASFTDLARKYDVSACSQNQAFNAILFSYRDVFCKTSGRVNVSPESTTAQSHSKPAPDLTQIQRPSNAFRIQIFPNLAPNGMRERAPFANLRSLRHEGLAAGGGGADTRHHSRQGLSNHRNARLLAGQRLNGIKVFLDGTGQNVKWCLVFGRLSCELKRSLLDPLEHSMHCQHEAHGSRQIPSDASSGRLRSWTEHQLFSKAQREVG